ncbi:MAG: chromate transporter [Chloroflexi bacterium]|nr:chromate transporter [Chloroflexota bacterium]
MARLLDLIIVFAPLSLVAVGGANTIVPDVHRQVVMIHAWMTDSEFADAYTLAQAVPGPNIMVVCLIGWQVAGLPGALVALVATCGPSSILALIVARSLAHARMAFWRQRLQVGLAPLTVGLMVASGVVLARSADHSLVSVGLTLVTALVLLRTSLHPLLLMGAGAVLGLLGVI